MNVKRNMLHLVSMSDSQPPLTGLSVSLEIRHLKLVRAIRSEGNLTRAADRLHLTQSALSHQLRDVEERLGAQLFQRSRRGLLPTPAGLRLLQAAETVLDELERAEAEVRRAGPTGLIRLSTECYTTYHWLPQALSLFQRRRPEVEVRIVVEATHRPFEALLEGELDVAIVSSTRQDRRIAYQPIFKDELVAVLWPGHRLAGRRVLRPEDFVEENLILYTIPRDRSHLFAEVLGPAGVSPRRVLHVGLTEAIVELVAARQGIGVLARWAVAPQVRAGRLVTRPITSRGLHRTWSAATLRRRRVPGHIEEFVRTLPQLAKPGGPWEDLDASA